MLLACFTLSAFSHKLSNTCMTTLSYSIKLLNLNIITYNLPMLYTQKYIFKTKSIQYMLVKMEGYKRVCISFLKECKINIDSNHAKKIYILFTIQ